MSIDEIGLILADKTQGPLVWALLETAAKEGASVREFERACETACSYLKAKASRIKASELCDKEDARRDVLGKHFRSGG